MHRRIEARKKLPAGTESNRQNLIQCYFSTERPKMEELHLVKSDKFGNVQCDFYTDGKDYFMTREQIGAALEYSDPVKAISNLHSAHKARMDKYSTTLEARKVEGDREVARKTIAYPRKGIMEICRWSQQPKADAFMDWTWAVMDALMSGKAKILPMSEYQRMKLAVQSKNAAVRTAREYEKLAEKYKGQPFAQVLDSYATKELTGEHLIPLPATQKGYSAGEIGEMFGISGTAVGIIANRNGLKVDKVTGEYRHDKSRSSSKEVPNFYYFDCALPEFEKLAAQWKADHTKKKAPRGSTVQEVSA